MMNEREPYARPDFGPPPAGYRPGAMSPGGFGPAPVLPYQPPGYAAGQTPYYGRARDDEHIRLLALFHYIWGGLTMAFSSIFIIHLVMGIAIIANPAFLNGPAAGRPGGPPPGGPSPEFMGWVFVLLGGGAVLFGWTCGLLTIYSGRCMKARRRRTFSLIIAGLNCLSMPIGTTLGIFTFLVLLRESVAAQYAEAAAAPPRGAA